MNVLVIGGTAFMGPEIVRRLVARGHDVRILHRRDGHIARDRIASAGGQFAAPVNLYFGEYLDLPPYTVNVEKVQRVIGLTPDADRGRVPRRFQLVSRAATATGRLRTRGSPADSVTTRMRYICRQPPTQEGEACALTIGPRTS